MNFSFREDPSRHVAHIDPPQMFIDEAWVSPADLKKIRAGRESELARTLQLVARHSLLAWASLSSSALLEIGVGSFSGFLLGIVASPFRAAWGLAPTSLTSRLSSAASSLRSSLTLPPVTVASLTSHLSLHAPDFTPVHLGHCMRSSGAIAAAADPGAVQAYRGIGNRGGSSVSVLPRGAASTVKGPRPQCLMTSWSGPTPDYPKMSLCLRHYLSSLPPPLLRGHIAVLCSPLISPGRVAALLSSHSPALYQAGVDTYDPPSGRPVLLPAGQGGGERGQVEAWLRGGGGMLVTHSRLFNGLECPVVIMLAGQPCDDPGSRSALLRATAGLALICNSNYVKEKELKKTFDVVKI